jgi:ATP-dependent DNA helicase PIF1
MQPTSETTYSLTANQQEAFNLIEGSSRNIIILGKPGVGKSVLINHLTREGRKYYTLAAPTGLAALNIGGRTLHSLFALPTSEGVIMPSYNLFTSNDRVLNNIRYQIKYLIIDECSMVRADMFDYINRLLKFVKGNDLPFGGVQLILVGDFFQLPPVVRTPEKPQIKEAGYNSPFLFSSHAYREGNFQPFILHEVLRQKGDPDFIDLLHSARTGNVKASQLAQLNKQVGYIDDLRIQLAATNAQADQINGGKLRSISGEPKQYRASIFGEWKEKPVEEELNIKVGAQVMVKMNGADRPEGARGEWPTVLVNGTIGKVVEMHDDYVVIELEDGTQHNVYRKRWEKKVKQQVDGEWREVTVASFEQMPLALAWAISIHKSQGQSFDKVHIDLSKVFAAGQSYVALSRCRSIAGTTLTAPITPQKFWADVEVKRYFNSLENE